MKKMKKLLPVLGGLLIVLTIGLTWTACEKEIDDGFPDTDAEVYVWMHKYSTNTEGKTVYTMTLYGGNTKLREYTYDWNTTYLYIGKDNCLMKNVWDTAKSEIRVYKWDKLISTCRYKDNGYSNIPTSAAAHGSYIIGNDVYVRSCFYYDYDEEAHTRTKVEIILWKNGEIIWRRDAKYQPWSGIGKIGTDLYWLIDESDENGTHSLYKNGELLKTYETKYSHEIMHLTVLDDNLYRYMAFYHGADVWRNDELIFEDADRRIRASSLVAFDGDWYLVGTTYEEYEHGKIFKNGEVLYDISIERDDNAYYHVEMDGVYKHRSNIYSWGYIRVMDAENKQPTYQTIWKNGERWFSYPLNTGEIYSVFKK